MKSTQIRNSFINYFKKNGHTHIASSSLIPDNDPTLLFTNAGMNQFKNVFLGLERRDYSRAVTAQKCVRAGGKHNDLENVGFTARHHTFFEMLGNFSFGDYFKKDAIHFAWELLTKEWGIPKERLFITVHLNDDEAADIWHQQEAIPRDRIFRFDKDNFWRMGDTGPCGPCTEIFYNHGELLTPEKAFKSIEAGEDQVVEIWNNVFMQFEETEPGKLLTLPKPSVDTGAGLERIAALMQGKVNNYDSDLFAPMIEKACQIGNFEYINDPKILAQYPDIKDRTAAIRVLADHCRSTGFLLADGALPSNEGRGYVLRRIMRRGIRYGKKLTDQSLLPKMVATLIEHMGDFYPELQQRKDSILSIIHDEENRFSAALDQGTQILNEEIKKTKSKGLKILSGDIVFKLYDTYGFPADLTRVIANENNIHVDDAAFEKEMQQAKEKAKTSWKGRGLPTDEAHMISFANENHKPTQFMGYEATKDSGKIVALSNGHKSVLSLKSSETGLAILDKTTFYAEGGGQVGDCGFINSTNNQTEVHNCTKYHDVFIHHIEVKTGEIKVGDTVTLEVSTSERRNIMSNHSATHLLHSALRTVLGTHITQAGSLVDATKTRFDFTHNKSLSTEEINKIEQIVNHQIALATDVKSEVMKHSEAINKGAMALFGEKYGDTVRVLTMGDFSCELCGGTHVKNTSQIRMFKIVSESGVSAGVRRIEAITGDLAFQYFIKHVHENLRTRQAIGLNENWNAFLESSTETYLWVENKKQEIKNMEKEIKKLKGEQINIDEIIRSSTLFTTPAGPAKLVTADVDLEDREVLAQITDQLKNKIQSGIVIVVGKGESNHPIIVSVSKNITASCHAGNLLKEIATVMGGKGGGRPDFAQGAAPDRSKIKTAFEKIQKLVSHQTS